MWPVERSGRGADRVARSEVVTFQRGRHVGRHLRKPRRNACVLGLSARRHYWLAPRSDDAVGAAMLGQDAGEIAAVVSRQMPLRFCKLDWGRTNASCLKSDVYLQAFRPPVFRRSDRFRAMRNGHQPG